MLDPPSKITTLSSATTLPIDTIHDYHSAKSSGGAVVVVVLINNSGNAGNASNGGMHISSVISVEQYSKSSSLIGDVSDN